MSCPPNSGLMPLNIPRATMPTVLGSNMQNPGGYIGSYVPSDLYTTTCSSYGCSTASRPVQAACSNNVQAMGPCSAGFGLSSNQLFPTSVSPCDGFDQVLVSAPMDFLYADNLMNDVNVLTTNRNQSHDLRGEPAIAAVFSESNGRMEMGPFGGVSVGTIGPYEIRKATRTYIV